ncbi:Protein of uncharacterised function (DUF3296) [Providencia rettgeri]|nr:Protein of uncharacterised function (DUF3296) [Providencia rettgeri]
MKPHNETKTKKLKTINPDISRKIERTLKTALDKHPRLFIIRIDLRFPQHTECKKDSRVISRFFDSLKAQLKAYELKKHKQGQRVYPNGLKSLWVREIGPKNKNLHYHCVLLFNKDAFFTLGRFQCDDEWGETTKNLYSRINQAWHSALGIEMLNDGIIHVCSYDIDPIRYLHKGSDSFEKDYKNCVDKLSYLAKDYSKPYKDGNRVVGCSR